MRCQLLSFHLSKRQFRLGDQSATERKTYSQLNTTRWRRLRRPLIPNPQSRNLKNLRPAHPAVRVRNLIRIHLLTQLANEEIVQLSRRCGQEAAVTRSNASFCKQLRDFGHGSESFGVVGEDADHVAAEIVHDEILACWVCLDLVEV